MKSVLKQLFEKYVFIGMFANFFSLGTINATPLMAYGEGNHVLALILAILLYPTTIMIIIISLKDKSS